MSVWICAVCGNVWHVSGGCCLNCVRRDARINELHNLILGNEGEAWVDRVKARIAELESER